MFFFLRTNGCSIVNIRKYVEVRFKSQNDFCKNPDEWSVLVMQSYDRDLDPAPIIIMIWSR